LWDGKINLYIKKKWHGGRKTPSRKKNLIKTGIVSDWGGGVLLERLQLRREKGRRVREAACSLICKNVNRKSCKRKSKARGRQDLER